MNQSSFTTDDLLNILFAVLIIGYSLWNILGGIFFPKNKIPPQKGPMSREAEEEDDYDEDDDEEEMALPPPPPRPKVVVEPVRKSLPPEQKFATEKFEFHSKLDDFQQKTNIDERKLAINLHSSDELVSESLKMLYSEGTVYKKKTKKTARELIKSLPEEKLLLLSYEVFHVPVSKRESPFPWNS